MQIRKNELKVKEFQKEFELKNNQILLLKQKNQTKEKTEEKAMNEQIQDYQVRIQQLDSEV